jgi:hypothetical protein
MLQMLSMNGAPWSVAALAEFGVTVLRRGYSRVYLGVIGGRFNGTGT